MELLKDYVELFFTGPHDLCLLKDTSQHLELEDSRSFYSQLYWKSKVNEDQVLVELKKIWTLA